MEAKQSTSKQRKSHQNKEEQTQIKSNHSKSMQIKANQRNYADDEDDDYQSLCGVIGFSS